MIVIHYPTAFKALNAFIDTYNESVQTKKERLKTGAVMTARELIRIYGISLLKANGVKEIKQKDLPSLQTNNVQLSKLVKCSTRTIQRHLIKLKKAGFISSKVFHGSNSNFELLINPKIMLIKPGRDVNKPELQGKDVNAEVKRTQTFSGVPEAARTKCPHTYSFGNNINNIIIAVHNAFKMDGNNFKRSSLQLTAKKNEGYNRGYKRGYTGEIAPVFSQPAGKIQGAGEIASRVEQSGILSLSPDPARSNSLNLYVSLLWMMSRNLLYKDVDLTDNQVIIAKKLIRKLYDPVATEKLSLTHEHYAARIILVSKYLKKDASRFVQLPYKYFDTNNPTGFIGTKKWYYDDLKRKREVERELTLSRLIRKYQNNEKKVSDQKKLPLQLFRECENTLGKLGDPTLTQRFHAAVLHYETYRQISYPN